MINRRINIFTGHFGSGKTEVAVNFASKAVNTSEKVSIVDFDIVNPYFRTTDAKNDLEKKGIYVVTPIYANTNVDVPALPPQINTLFEKKQYVVVFDVGGDDVGARVLSRYRDEIVNDSYDMFMVINTRRPITDTADKIIEMIHSIEHTSRLKVTKLVNNTNLLGDTIPEDIIKGYKIVKDVSLRMNIPIGFTSGFSHLIHSVEDDIPGEKLFLDKLIKLPWD